MDGGRGRGPALVPSVAAGEQPKTPPPSSTASSGPLPKGRITEEQVAAFPEKQPMICGQCGRRVPTPKGASADGVVVVCGGCGGEVEAIPF